MVGAAVEFPITLDEGATVKQSGLPTGLKLGQNRQTQAWTITGYPTKAGTFYSTLTATLNNRTTQVALMFEVVPNEFTGEYRGQMVSYLRDDVEQFISTMTVNVAAGGAVSVSLTELGITTKYSTKSFNWDDLNGNAWIEFETKQTRALPFVRKVRLELIDRGGWKSVTGEVEHPEELQLANGTLEAWPVVTQRQLVDHGIIDPDEPAAPRLWNFTEDVWCGEGVYVPVVLMSTWLDVKKGTAKVTVKDSDGNKFAWSALPVVRIGDDEDDPAAYAYAPFGCYYKTGEMTQYFNLLALDGLDYEVWYDCDSSIRGEYIACDTEEYEYSAKQENFADLLDEEATVLCDFAQDQTEAFQLVKSSDGKKLDLFDAQGNKLTTLNLKLAKEGTVSFKFTDKDKVTYSFEVGYFGANCFRGLMTKTGKVGTESVRDWAIVEIY